MWCSSAASDRVLLVGRAVVRRHLPRLRHEVAGCRLVDEEPRPYALPCHHYYIPFHTPIRRRSPPCAMHESDHPLVMHNVVSSRRFTSYIAENTSLDTTRSSTIMRPGSDDAPGEEPIFRHDSAPELCMAAVDGPGSGHIGRTIMEVMHRPMPRRQAVASHASMAPRRWGEKVSGSMRPRSILLRWPWEMPSRSASASWLSLRA